MIPAITGADPKNEIGPVQGSEIGKTNNSSNAFSDITAPVVKNRLFGDLLSGLNLTQLLRESGLRVTVVEISYLPGDERRVT